MVKPADNNTNRLPFIDGNWGQILEHKTDEMLDGITDATKEAANQAASGQAPWPPHQGWPPMSGAGVPLPPPFYDSNVGPPWFPTFDGKYAHGTQVDPGLNQMFEITNMTQESLYQQALFQGQYGMMGPDPNMQFYQNFVANPMAQLNASLAGAPAGGNVTASGEAAGSHVEESTSNSSFTTEAAKTGVGAAGGAAIGWKFGDTIGKFIPGGPIAKKGVAAIGAGIGAVIGWAL